MVWYNTWARRQEKIGTQTGVCLDVASLVHFGVGTVMRVWYILVKNVHIVDIAHDKKD